MSGSSFSLSGLVNSIFGSNKKSKKYRNRFHKRHVCSSKCRHGKMHRHSRRHICNSKCGHHNKKRFSMKYRMRGG